MLLRKQRGLTREEKRTVAVNLDIGTPSTFLHRWRDLLLALHDPAHLPHSTLPEMVS